MIPSLQALRITCPTLSIFLEMSRKRLPVRSRPIWASLDIQVALVRVIWAILRVKESKGKWYLFKAASLTWAVWWKEKSPAKKRPLSDRSIWPNLSQKQSHNPMLFLSKSKLCQFLKTCLRNRFLMSKRTNRTKEKPRLRPSDVSTKKIARRSSPCHWKPWEQQ